MDAKPVFYQNISFDSQGEWRWYLLFKELGADIERNTKRFILRNGVEYIPDFVIRNAHLRYDSTKQEGLTIYVEVKGKMSADSEMKIKLFAEEHSILVVHAWIPEGDTLEQLTDYMREPSKANDKYLDYFNFVHIDGDWFNAYPSIGAYGHFTLAGDDGSYLNELLRKETIMAYAMARKAQINNINN